MDKTISLIQAGVSVLLIVAILLQNRGTGLSQIFGGGADNSSYQTKRGFDKFLFRATIVLGIIFFASALYQLVQK
jgi:preprotein translocase subunit SecG